MQRILLLVVAAMGAWLLLAAESFAQEIGPGDACTTANVTVWAGGPEASGKGYYMVCDGSTWQRIIESDASANVGIKRATPQTPLDVGGEVKIGTSTGLTCGSGREGAIRYDTTNNCIELCDGASWACIVSGAGCDNTPASFEFTDQSGLTASTLTTSDIVSITGTDSGCMLTVSVSGDGSPEYRICDDSSCSTVTQTWTTQNLDFDMQGKYVQLRATTSADPSTTFTITANVGNGSNDWQITTTSTGPCGDVGPGDEGTICSDGSVYAGVSPDGNRNMYVRRCDAGMSWDGSNCTGSRTSLPWNNGNSSNHTTTGFKSHTDGDGNTAGLAFTDSDSGTSGDQPHQAALWCHCLGDAVADECAGDPTNGADGHGKSDWYLPATDELDVIYKKLVDGTPEDNNPDPVISGFSTGEYWTSRETSDTNATRQDFSNGDIDFWRNKPASLLVRCARKD